jgi:hypothetical protein
MVRRQFKVNIQYGQSYKCEIVMSPAVVIFGGSGQAITVHMVHGSLDLKQEGQSQMS